MEELLASVVRAWVTETVPGAADRAAFLARHAYANGASLADACHEAAAFVSSWVQHPANAVPPGTVVPLAS